jgi:hypothetical protein
MPSIHQDYGYDLFISYRQKDNQIRWRVREFVTNLKKNWRQPPIRIFFARTTDRLGKGIRTGARDAMLSGEATPETKGRVFGLHRSMDTLGAVIGPTSALAYLYFYPGEYKLLFFIAFVPGVIAISFTYLIQESKTNEKEISLKSASVLSFAHYWKKSPASYKKLVIGLLAFTLVNSSDLFLLLKVKEAGLDDTAVISVYIFYNLVYVLAALSIGKAQRQNRLQKNSHIWTDFIRFGNTGMAFSHRLSVFFFLFFLYGIYVTATESVAKA